MKPDLLLHFPKIAHRKSEIRMMIVSLIITFIISTCSTTTSSTAYLPSELEKAVRQDATEFFTSTSTDKLYLDTITKLTIIDVRHTSSTPDVPLDDKDMWCLTTVAQGIREGVSHEVSQKWFGIKQEGKEWLLIPRHIVAYSAYWDYACDQAKRLDS